MRSVGDFIGHFLGGGRDRCKQCPVDLHFIVLAIASLIFAGGLFGKKSMYAIYTETGYIIGDPALY